MADPPRDPSGSGGATSLSARPSGDGTRISAHRTLPEIVSRLFLTQNTVKTETASINRKLGDVT